MSTVYRRHEPPSLIAGGPESGPLHASVADAAADAEATIIVTSKLAKKHELVIERAKMFQANGDYTAGRDFLMQAISRKNWTKSKLWWLLVPMMESAADYPHIRDFWLRSPVGCHSNTSILRAVARAAAVSGYHHDSRVLLRKLIVLLARRKRNAGFTRRRLRIPKRPSAGSGKNHPGDLMDFTQKASVALIDLNNAFANIGLKAFLISGALLGQVREGHIIGWDKDIDVGYFTEDCHVELEAHFLKSPAFRLGRIDFTSDRLRLIHRNGTWIDVFPHYMEGDRRWHNGTATRWWNTPFGLDTVSFLGIEQYVPDNPERYLDENYGDWRTPDSRFDARIDAPNVEIIDPEHYLSLLYFSLEKSIRGDKPLMKQRYVKLLREQGEGAWLDAL